MTPRSRGSSAGSADQTHQQASKSPGPFMLTLCKLAAPVAIPQPQAPHLKPFTFFMGRSRQAGGLEQLQLYMGYFATLPEAQHWLQRMRGAYPHAVVSTVPAALLRLHASRVPVAAAVQPPAAQVAVAHQVPTDAPSLTDTQVFRILDTRRADTNNGPAAGDTQGSDISLLRPEDTGTRHLLKQAIANNAPVSFAVQLQWAVGPVDPATIPSLEIFRAYTLYTAQGEREGRTWQFLRLGFFNDALSARQVAHYVRSEFTSVAVVPVSEQERAGANENRVRLPASRAGEPTRNEAASASGQGRKLAAPPPSAPVRNAPTPSASKPAGDSKQNSSRTARGKVRSGEETLEQTLEMLAASVGLNVDSDEETGVRHLRVNVQKRA